MTSHEGLLEEDATPSQPQGGCVWRPFCFLFFFIFRLNFIVGQSVTDFGFWTQNWTTTVWRFKGRSVA